jgi:hypothetical protein
MIELDGQTYPSEVRQSQPVALESQETPAGSSEFPGLSEELGLNRHVVEGEVISASTDAPFMDPADRVDALRGAGVVGPGVGLVGGAQAYASGVGVHDASSSEGEEVDGLPGDPSGEGTPMPRAGQDNAPKLLAEDLPWQPGEREAASALLAEMREISAESRVERFVRYPDDRRVMLVFHVGEERRSIQQQY